MLALRHQTEEAVMQCVICKRGEVKPAKTQVEVKVGSDHLLVSVDAEVCAECGEAYYSTETMRHLEKVKDNFARKLIAPPLIGHVYQIP
jgi:YgiT-type zinc finger domain-containing protein